MIAVWIVAAWLAACTLVTLGWWLRGALDEHQRVSSVDFPHSRKGAP